MEQVVFLGLGLVQRVTWCQSPLDSKECAGFKMVQCIWNIMLYMLKGAKEKVEQGYEFNSSLKNSFSKND